MKDQAAARREVAAYARMSSLQGVHVPRLVAHGYVHMVSKEVQFVATEFLEVILFPLVTRLSYPVRGPLPVNAPREQYSRLHC